MLCSEEIWQHPLVAPAFDADLRRRLLDAADQLPRYVDEIEEMPAGASHGDACTNNILVRPDSDDLVLIDFGFWMPQPFGFDLGQLLLGDVQLGRSPAHDLIRNEKACTSAYVEGLRREGCDVDGARVRRAHALLMLIFSGMSAIPGEHLDSPPTPELRRIAAERATAARFMLDLVDATA
jgi:thiamine kinase-like enzyme